MIYTTLTRQAMNICYNAHAGQVDKSGVPYLFHPIHVAEQMEDEDSTVVALLHDVIEDTPWTIEDLEAQGFGAPILEALRLMTHDPSVPYFDYVKKIGGNPIARKVKLTDLAHNIDLRRLDHEPTAADLVRLRKYHQSIQILLCNDFPANASLEIDIPKVIGYLKDRASDIDKYCMLMKTLADCDICRDAEVQKLFTGFYQIRRDRAWRDDYYQLFEEMKRRKPCDIAFDEILLRLFRKSGQIEASFASKMLASLCPNKPIWDQYVLQNLGLRVQGGPPTIRLSNTIAAYDRICNWYTDFMATAQSKRLLQAFDEAFPDCTGMTAQKKIDFMIWANRG